MKKNGFILTAIVFLASSFLLTHPVYGKKAPVQAQMKSAQVQQKPYTRDDPGPWADKVKAHVPEITYEKTGTGLKVTVKVDNHPMDPKTPHYIMMIKLEDGSGAALGQKDFVATDPAPPIATFELKSIPGKLKAYERCNIHGLWMNEVDVTTK